MMVLSAALLVTTVAVAQEQSEQDAVTRSDVEREVSDAGRTLGRYAAEQKDQAVKEAEQLALALDERIERLEAQARTASEASAAKLNSALEAMRHKRAVMEARLAALRKSSSGAWEDIRQGFVGAWYELKGAVLDAQERLATKGADKQ
ncbi:MAG: hypothetical protein KDK91_10375 [Gammaproteobacteria bacterium]|nr:hypothetical protein [Gammaproteobacteria bacterium]